MFTSDDIRSITAYLKESAKEALSQEPSDPEGAEQLIKVARQFHVETGNPSKFKVVSRWQSYHGSSIAGLSISGSGSWRKNVGR